MRIRLGGTLLIAILASSCLQSHHSAPLVAARMPLASYAQTLLQHGSGRISVDFPVLEFYDRSGTLRYHSAGQTHSGDFIGSLPRGIPAPEPGDRNATLRATLEIVPAWKASEEDILSHRRYALVFVGLAGCPACATEQQTLEAARERLLKRGIEVLTLELTRE